MKPFYTQDVLVEASREELAMIRVALASWVVTNDKDKNGKEEDRVYLGKMRKLYNEVTEVMNSLPF